MTNGSARAFTLVEILVVIVLLVTLSALAIPLMSGSLARSEARGALTRLTSMTATAQSLAVTEGRTFRLNFDEEKGVFWLTHEQDAIEAPGEYSDYKHSSVARIELQDSLKIQRWKITVYPQEGEEAEQEEEEIHFVEFRRDGTADEAIFVFETIDGDASTLMISSMTGRVRVMDYALEEEEDEASAKP